MIFMLLFLYTLSLVQQNLPSQIFQNLPKTVNEPKSIVVILKFARKIYVFTILSDFQISQ